MPRLVLQRATACRHEALKHCPWHQGCCGEASVASLGAVLCLLSSQLAELADHLNVSKNTPQEQEIEQLSRGPIGAKAGSHCHNHKKDGEMRA